MKRLVLLLVLLIACSIHGQTINGVPGQRISGMYTTVESSNYAVDPTGTNDSTSAIQAMMNAAGALVEVNPFTGQSGITTTGGGVIHLAKGKYKVTATLLYRGGTTFEGDGEGTEIMFCPTVANSDLFSADTSNYTWSGTMIDVKFKNLYVMVPSSCGTASDVRYAYNMTTAQRSVLENTRIDSGFTIDAYYAIGGGGGYYNNIINPYWFGATTNALYVASTSNAINVYGGDMRDISGSYSKSYLVYSAGAGLSMYGTSLEGNVTTAQVDCEGPTNLIGGYSELPGAGYAAPIMDVNLAVANRLTGACKAQGYLGAIYKYHNAIQTTQNTGSPSAAINPVSLEAGNPTDITNQVIVDPDMSNVVAANMSNYAATWNTASGVGANGTCAQSTTNPMPGGNGTYSYVMTNNGSGILTCGQTTPYQNLIPYIGQDLYLGVWVKTDGNTQTIQIGAYGSCGSYGSGTGCGPVYTSVPIVTRDDGWSLYVLDVQIIAEANNTQDLVWYIEQSSAANTVKAYIGGAQAFVGGYDWKPTVGQENPNSNLNGNTSVLSANSTTTSASFVTLGLSLPTVPAGQAKVGWCDLTWEDSSSTDAVGLALNTSGVSTGFQVLESFENPSTSTVLALLPPAAATTATNTTIRTSASPVAATTYVNHRVTFSLITSTVPVVVTVYGEIASAGTLTLKAGSSCGWNP